VNPFSEEEIAAGIASALQLSPAERKRRMFRMRATVAENNVFRWAANILSTLAKVDVAGADHESPEAVHSERGIRAASVA